jgi:hypothetical protein
MSTRTVRTLSLGAGQVATLLRETAGTDTGAAVLYVHGFSDYFFQDHVATHFTRRGADF